MGFFFSDSSNLSLRDVDRVLDAMGILESSDRRYIKRLLKDKKAGGISKGDVKKVVRKLKRDRDDNVSRAEAEAAGRELLKELEEEKKE